MKIKTNKNILRLLKKIFFENFKIKAVCFVLAVLTYFMVGIFQRGEKVVFCKLNIVGLKDSYTISSDIPEVIKVVVRDKQRILDKINENDFNLTLDSSLFDNNKTNEIPINYNVPGEMQSFFSTIDLIPSKIKVNVEKLSEKTVPIAINYVGKLEPGFMIKKTTIEPYEVRIQGAEKLINKIKFIETEKIIVNGENKFFKREIFLLTPNRFIKIIGKGKAEVTFEIEKEANFLTYKFESVYFKNLKSQFKSWIEKSIITIKINGNKEDLDNINQENIYLYVDCSSINEQGIYNLKVESNLAKNINMISINPDIIKVHVEEKKY